MDRHNTHKILNNFINDLQVEIKNKHQQQTSASALKLVEPDEQEKKCSMHKKEKTAEERLYNNLEKEKNGRSKPSLPAGCGG